MGALEVWREALDQDDRPTMPVPEARESGVRLQVAKVAYGFAMIDAVVCDLSRDPRSEFYVQQQEARPPALATVHALR